MDLDEALPSCPDCLERLTESRDVAGALVYCPDCGRYWSADELASTEHD